MLLPVAVLVVAAISCTSVWSKKYKDEAGVMYGMIYDEKEEGVAGVSVKVNGALKAVSDGQGRFILQFYFADIKDKKEQHIVLEKEGYEKFEEVFYYEPMSLLHLRVESGEGLLTEAEEAMEKGEYAVAEGLIDRASDIEESREESLFLKAVIRYKEGRRTEALAVLKSMKGQEAAAVQAFMKRLEEERE